MLEFFKKYWIFILLAFLATTLFAIKFLVTPPKTEVTATPTTQPAPSPWRGVVPGETTLGELEQKLGSPVSKEEIDDKTRLSFESKLGGPPDEVFIKENKVELVKEQVLGEKNLSEFKNKMGEVEGIFWGPYQEAGYQVFVFPKQGTSVIASIRSGLVLEVWYFKPMQLSEFLATWGSDLKAQPERKF